MSARNATHALVHAMARLEQECGTNRDGSIPTAIVLEILNEANSAWEADEIASHISHDAPAWHCAETDQPESCYPVLCRIEWDEGEFLDVGELDGDGWVTDALCKPALFFGARVTHWHELPEFAP